MSDVDKFLGTAGKVLGIASGMSDLFGGNSGTSWDNQKGAMFFQADLQREFAKHGVRWRVEDAEAAGLHPLAALGMQPVQGGAIPVMAEPSSRGRTHSETAAAMAALSAASAAVEKDHAMAEYYRALAHKTRQDPSVAPFPDLGNASGWVMGSGGGSGDLIHQGRTPGMPGELQPFFNRRQVMPSQVYSANEYDPSLEAATGVAWKSWNMGNGFSMVLPSSNTMSEALEALGESKLLLAFAVAENSRRYGARWLTEFMGRYGDLFDWSK